MGQIINVFYRWPGTQFWMSGIVVLTRDVETDYNSICNYLGISDDEVLIYTDSPDPEYIKENFDGLDVIIVQEARL